jgi:5'(3')-deoxyribonucleotidase
MNLFIDSDGVIADFEAHWFTLFDESADEMRKKLGKEKLWELVRNKDPKFFENLPIMAGAIDLISSTVGYDPIILTGSPTEWGYLQKINWFRKHFSHMRVIVCKAKEKHLFCEPGDVLIDDRTKYRAEWIDVGGIFIHHTSVKSTLFELSKNTR